VCGRCKKQADGLWIQQVRWRVGVREIAAGVNPATPICRDKPGSKLD